jgi:hypothetical protein
VTYPTNGYSWRNNVVKSYDFHLDPATIDLLFTEVPRIRKEYPEQCLTTDQLWSDASEKANGITRDRETRNLCYTIHAVAENGKIEEQYALRENSTALLSSVLFSVISGLIAPYERLPIPDVTLCGKGDTGTSRARRRSLIPSRASRS